MISCPCCSQTMAIHVRHSGVYWYCSSCRQEMPDLLSIVLNKAAPAHHNVALTGDWQLTRQVAQVALQGD